ncbi:MAG: hypothetical protein R3B72_35545 [Polyangiaceae bacterium]
MQPAFRLCFEEARGRDPEVQGDVVARFTIAGGGEPAEVCLLESEVDDPIFVDCLAEVLLAAPLASVGPSTRGPLTTIVFPLRFRSLDLGR